MAFKASSITSEQTAKIFVLRVQLLYCGTSENTFSLKSWISDPRGELTIIEGLKKKHSPCNYKKRHLTSRAHLLTKSEDLSSSQCLVREYQTTFGWGFPCHLQNTLVLIT
jgi:hypothetical protein